MLQFPLIACAIMLAVKIARYDIQTHLIKDLDLILLLFIFFLLGNRNLNFGILYLAIFLSIHLITLGKLGFGDVKLALVLGFTCQTFIQLILYINIAWILGGIWAMMERSRNIAFAPSMLIGALFGQLII